MPHKQMNTEQALMLAEKWETAAVMSGLKSDWLQAAHFYKIAYCMDDWARCLGEAEAAKN